MGKRILYLVKWMFYFPVFIILLWTILIATLFYGAYDYIANGDSERPLDWFGDTCDKLLL